MDCKRNKQFELLAMEILQPRLDLATNNVAQFHKLSCVWNVFRWTGLHEHAQWISQGDRSEEYQDRSHEDHWHP